MLDKIYGKFEYRGTRGRVIHEAISKYFKKIFKTSDRYNRMNYRIYSQRLTKAKAEVLSDVNINPDYSLYQEDVNILLNQVHKEIRAVAKNLSKESSQIVVPEEIELVYFGGIASFEINAEGKIGGIKVPAKVDCLIEKDNDHFIVRDFKSYDRDDKSEPFNSESEHRNFMQVCLYAIIFEQERNQRCEAIELAYFPNDIVSFEFTEELREMAKNYVIDTAFEGFEGIEFQFGSTSDNSQSPPPTNPSNDIISKPYHNVLGWINTIKGKPLQLILGQDNRMEGFLYPNQAHRVKVGYCVIVEKEEDGIRIISVVKKIECSEDHFPGETSSHKEENYKIILIPLGQFTPEGYQDLQPQTVIVGKIKIPKDEEFCEFKKIPQNGIPIGILQGLNSGILYPLEKKALYQSVFISGQQGTGKTTSLKQIITQLKKEKRCPAQIILDNEGEYGDLSGINFLTIDSKNGFCLTLKAIDPVDLPYFLHELTPISHETLQTVIYDIIEDNKGKSFTLPKLKAEIFSYIERESYGAISATKFAIKRALNSIALRLFDVPDTKPIDVESILKAGTITVVNTSKLRDAHQRMVGLYLLAILHKRVLKGGDNLNVLLYLDEIQRLIPKSNSQSDSEYQKRIIKFLDEIVHRGRKRDYGVLFATQSISDVKKDIIDLCNTKIFFQTQGSGLNYIKEYFNSKEDLERLKSLPIGQAFITSKGKHEPVEIKFPKFY